MSDTAVQLKTLRDFYDIIGEAPIRASGKWSVPELSSAWISPAGKADRDPRGNASGSDTGSRWCALLTTGAVELRETDRIIVLRLRTGTGQS
jgi:hypothetical protein